MSEARDFALNDSVQNDNVEVPYAAEAYARWAPFYDMTFRVVMRPGRRAIAAIASEIGGPVLDVGVGTGLELPMFAPHIEVTGIDLCEPMLRRAKERIKRERLKNVPGLLLMDATQLAFPDDTFACVVAPYLLPVAPVPEAILDELARVVKPGGEIILVNHVSNEDDMLSMLEPWLAKHIAPKLGWRLQFQWSIIGDWIDQREDMRLLDRRLLAPFGLFTLTRIKRLSGERRSFQPKNHHSEKEFA